MPDRRSDQRAARGWPPRARLPRATPIRTRPAMELIFLVGKCIFGEGGVVITGIDMRKSICCLMLCALTAAIGLAAAPQAPAAPHNRVIGVVTAADEASASLKVK